MDPEDNKDEGPQSRASISQKSRPPSKDHEAPQVPTHAGSERRRQQARARLMNQPKPREPLSPPEVNIDSKGSSILSSNIEDPRPSDRRLRSRGTTATVLLMSLAKPDISTRMQLPSIQISWLIQSFRMKNSPIYHYLARLEEENSTSLVDMLGILRRHEIMVIQKCASNSPYFDWGGTLISVVRTNAADLMHGNVVVKGLSEFRIVVGWSPKSTISSSSSSSDAGYIGGFTGGFPAGIRALPYRRKGSRVISRQKRSHSFDYDSDPRLECIDERSSRSGSRSRGRRKPKRIDRYRDDPNHSPPPSSDDSGETIAPEQGVGKEGEELVERLLKSYITVLDDNS